MEHLVYWNCKEKNSALPKQINEFGDTVGREDICAQLATIYDIVGDMSMDRLKELVDADKQGRCVVTPFKVGDEVFKIKHGKIESDKVYRITIDVFGNVFIKLQWEHESIKEKDARKIVFLTKEDAEEALEKEN